MKETFTLGSIKMGSLLYIIKDELLTTSCTSFMCYLFMKKPPFCIYLYACFQKMIQNSI